MLRLACAGQRGVENREPDGVDPEVPPPAATEGMEGLIAGVCGAEDDGNGVRWGRTLCRQGSGQCRGQNHQDAGGTHGVQCNGGRPARAARQVVIDAGFRRQAAAFFSPMSYTIPATAPSTSPMKTPEHVQTQDAM